MSLTKVSYSMLNGAPVNVFDFGAIGDGISDDTVAFQAAATSAAGKTLYVPAGFTYIVKNIQLSANTYVFGGGNLKLKVLAAGDGSPILKINGNNVTIDGILFDGDKAAQPADGFSDSYAISVTGLGRAYRAAINTGGEPTSGNFTNITVQNCFFSNTYGAGLATQNCSGVRFLSNICDSLYFESVFASTTTSGKTDIQITGNKITNIASGHVSINPNAILVAQSDRVIISDNIIFDVERDGIKQEGGNDIVISNNTIQSNSIDGFPAIAVQGNSTIGLAITGNVLRNVQRGIQLNSALFTSVTISGNSIHNTTAATGDGIQLASMTAGSTDITIAGNTISNVNRFGVYATPLPNKLKIVGNSISGKLNGNQIGIGFAADTATTSNALTIENNIISDFVQSASSNGVITTFTNVTITNLVCRGNTILAGASTNRAVSLQLTNGLSGVFDNNYVDGLIVGTQTGLTSFGNLITGTTSLVTGSRS
jgi:parallel beta-helix repeat protein